jgi:Icc-related predicted phosphoesterase
VNSLSRVFSGITSPKLTVGTYGPVPFIQLPLKIQLTQANAHWHIIGTSGSGKSFFLAQLFLSLTHKGLPVTLIDPHGDLAKLVLAHLVGQGRYKDPETYERIVYLDLPEGERQERYVSFNPLKQDNPDHTIASTFKEALHRAFPELSQGAAIFDTLLPRALRVLLANNLPLTALEPFLWDEQFRTRLLERYADSDGATIAQYFRNVYAELRRSEQITYAGSVLRRTALLTDLPILRYSLSQPDNLLQFREIIDSGRSVIINLAVRELEASRLLGCLLTVGYEQAALSRADNQQRRSHHLIVDEFHSFATNSSQAFASMLSQTRKYGLYLGLAHQFWGQANQHLQEALQNTGIEVVFNLGRTDAEYTARELSRIDPLQVKHEVVDEYAVEKTHPVFYSLPEQWQTFTEYLQDLPPRHFVLKVRGQKVKAGKTRHLPEPKVEPKELIEVEQEYLRRYFRANHEIARETRGMQEMRQAIPMYQSINRRERLR